MRLLDQIAQNTDPLWIQPPGLQQQPIRLPGASDYARRVASCPLRYVLTDEITATCAQLALAGGDRLSDCLDLIHLPAPQMWLEWNDAPRAEIMEQLCSGQAVAGARSSEAAALATGKPVKAGVLISSSRNGRRGMLNTFWSDPSGTLNLSPAETHLDLEAAWPDCVEIPPLDGGWVRASAPDSALQELFDRLRFRIEPQ